MFFFLPFFHSSLLSVGAGSSFLHSVGCAPLVLDGDLAQGGKILIAQYSATPTPPHTWAMGECRGGVSHGLRSQTPSQYPTVRPFFGFPRATLPLNLGIFLA